MPIYEYFCEDCHKKFEVLIFFHGERAYCPSCGKESHSRLFSRFAFSSGKKSKEENSSGGNSSSCATCSGGDCSTCRS